MKTLTEYQEQKVNYWRSKLAYHRANIEAGRKVEYNQQKVEYLESRLEQMGVTVGIGEE